jgi:hypothetical protein
VYWNATLEPTQVLINDTIAKGVPPRELKFGKKAKK